MRHTRLLILLALGSASLLVGILWLAERGGGPAALDSRSARGASPDRPLLDSLEARRIEVLPPDRTESTASAEQPTAEDELVRSFLDGRVVDERGEPSALAEIWHREETGEKRLGTTGDDGWIRLELALPRAVAKRHRNLVGPLASFEIDVLKRGFAGAKRLIGIAEERTTHLGTIVLEPGAELSALILDERGAPLSGVQVWSLPEECLPDDPDRAGLRAPEDLLENTIEHTDWKVLFVPASRSGADGRAELRGIAPGSRFLVAGAHLRRTAWTQPFEAVRGSPSREFTLRLLPIDPLDLLSGRVVDADDEPITGARVRVGPEDVDDGEDWTSSAHTDDTGRFEVVLEERSPCRLRVDTPDDFGSLATLEGVLPGTRDLLVRVAPARTIAVVLQDTHGAPIPWGSVRAHGPLVELGRSGRGRFTLPRTRFSMQAFAPGFRRQDLGPLDPPQVEDPLVITLEPGQALRGRVTFEGRPMRGARVSIGNALPPDKRMQSGFFADATAADVPFDVLGSRKVNGNDATTDARGAFCATLHGAGWSIVCVEADGFPATVVGPFQWDREEGADGIEIPLQRAGAIEGRVVPPAGRSPSEFVVGASDGWGVVYTSPVGEDGRYRIEKLAPGRWQVRRCLPPVNAVQPLFGSFWRDRLAPIEWDCEVVSGATAGFDLDLSGVDAFVFRGRFTIDGRPPEEDYRGAALLEPDSKGSRIERPLAWAVVGEEGEFEFKLSRETGAILRLRSAAGSFYQPIAVVRGITEWQWHLQGGSLTVRAGPSAGEGSADAWLVWRGEEERSFFADLSSPAALLESGPETLTVPAGRAWIARPATEQDSFRLEVLAEPWILMREVEIRPGEETAVELP